MANFDDYKAILNEIRAEWNQAEEDIKLAEQVCDEVVLPAIKELRYAGRRIVDALNEMAGERQEKRISEYLQDAKFDCHRARHDAIDAATSRMQVTLKLMADKLSKNVILKACPDFAKFWGQLSEANDTIVQTRGPNRENRDQLYAGLEQINFKQLVGDFGKIQRAEPIMIALAREDKLTRWISYAFGMGGLILTALNLLF